MVDKLQVFEKAGLTCFPVRAQPRSSRCRVVGVHNGALKVQLTAPALEDRANRQLVEFLADQLRFPKSAVRLVSGEKSRSKTVGVDGTSPEVLRQRLHQLSAGR